MSQALLSLMGVGGVSPPLFAEDCFACHTYTGTGASQTITNGIDLAGKGGLVWIKDRGDAATYHALFDTERGVNARMYSSETDPNASAANTLTAFNSNGFSLGTNANQNTTSHNLISWTFRKAAKFFDIVTYTGNGSNRTISHNLGQVPGMIIVKRMDTTGSWMVYHRSLANTENLVLNTTAAKATNATAWNSTTATTSVFSLGTHADVNTNGGTYVAYLFAHDTGTDGLIQCGSYTGNGSAAGPTVTLGWEPQFVIVKVASGSTGQWSVVDSMRGLCNGTTVTDDKILFANLTNAEGTYGWIKPTATGFTLGDMDYGANWNGNGNTYIYLAIRRPNKPPTTGTQVYNAIAYTGNGVDPRTLSVGFAADLGVVCDRNGIGLGGQKEWSDRLRGSGGFLRSTGVGAEDSARYFTFRNTDVLTPSVNGGWNESGGGGGTYINHFFRRAPGVFDVVCYTGTGSAHTESHNLGVAPEMMIVKKRSAADAWYVYAGDATDYLVLNTTAATADLDTIWNDTAPTASVFSIGTHDDVNQNTGTFVAYLFATKAGISKVFSYTGNGTNQNIECGFAAGARFVLIKRTDSTGDWLVADTTRGIIAGNDPSLALNSTAAEVTTLDWIDPYSGGFNVVQESTNNANVNNATYIGLAFA